METTEAEPLLYSIPEGRKRLGGLGTTTIYDLIKRGELEKVNIGRRGFITAASIERYVERLSGRVVA